jgi:hypothetical protein
LRRPLPTFELALAQMIDEIVLLGRSEIGKAALVLRLAGAVDPTQSRAIEVHKRRARLGDAQAQERVGGRLRELLIHEVGDAVLARPDRQGLADRFERRHLLRSQHAKRHPLGARLPGGEQNLGTAHREDQRTQGRGLDEIASRNLRHGTSLPVCLLVGFSDHFLA